MRRIVVLVLLAVTAAACGNDVDISQVPELPPTTADEMADTLASSDGPIVLNVWASWCIPCRSEAPLLERAAATQSDVRFIGLNVRDDQEGARAFIAEFFSDAPIDHLFDPSGDIPVALGGSRGVPLTFFYSASGELVKLHTGVIDERTLALEIDEIRSR